MAELPADLQDVYDELHLTEKQFEVLDDFLEKALAVMENEQKYEAAMQMMAEDIVGRCEYNEYCSDCYYDCDKDKEKNKCETPVEYREQIIKHYKQRAGIEVKK